jgi:hypothetical protein
MNKLKWKWSYYTKSKRLYNKGQWLNIKRHGKYESYYYSGLFYEKGYFKSGEKIGFWLTNYSESKKVKHHQKLFIL